MNWVSDLLLTIELSCSNSSYLAEKNTLYSWFNKKLVVSITASIPISHVCYNRYKTDSNFLPQFYIVCQTWLIWTMVWICNKEMLATFSSLFKGFNALVLKNISVFSHCLMLQHCIPPLSVLAPVSLRPFLLKTQFPVIGQLTHAWTSTAYNNITAVPQALTQISQYLYIHRLVRLQL